MKTSGYYFTVRVKSKRVAIGWIPAATCIADASDQFMEMGLDEWRRQDSPKVSRVIEVRPQKIFAGESPDMICPIVPVPDPVLFPLPVTPARGWKDRLCLSRAR